MAVNDYDVCIIGSGPAAHTAAIYTSRANLKTVLFEGWMANDIAPGGQLTTTSIVENFPGFPGGITGSELCDKFREQSKEMGTNIVTETVTKICQGYNPVMIPLFYVSTSSQTICAKAVIIATGAVARKLEFPGASQFWNAGISACAVCDGAAPIFRNKPIAVIGGGDSAMEEALFLTKYASCVYIIHRRDQFRASKVMQDRALSHPKIKVLWNSVVTSAQGDKILREITVKNVATSEETNVQVGGLFFAIGHEPASEFVKDLVATDDQGYIITQAGSTATNVQGVFAAGDVQDKKWRQAITAAGSGCIAALEVEHYLSSLYE